jgi:hypothetical protein
MMDKTMLQANHTRATKGVADISKHITARRTWCHGQEETGFLSDDRPTPRVCVHAPVTVTGEHDDGHDALDEVLALIGGEKPARLSWTDFGRIVAAAYAVGGRDAAYLDRIVFDARVRSDFDERSLDEIFWLVAALYEDDALAASVEARAKALKESRTHKAL